MTVSNGTASSANWDRSTGLADFGLVAVMADAQEVEVTPEMIEAGKSAWFEESGFYGPPDVDGAAVVVAIFKAMACAGRGVSGEAP